MINLKDYIKSHVPVEKCSSCNGTGKIVTKFYKNRCKNCYSMERRLFEKGPITASCKDRWCPAVLTYSVTPCSNCKGEKVIKIKPFNPVIFINELSSNQNSLSRS